MLKLERIARSQELNVSLRDKPSFLSHSFLLALSYALFSHLLALLLFQISPFKISYEASIIPPVLVASDFMSGDYMQGVTAHYYDQSIVPDYLILPSRPVVQLPLAVRESSPLKKDSTMYHDLTRNPFLRLEDEIALGRVSDLFGDSVDPSPLVVRSSGDIAERKMWRKKDDQSAIEAFALRQPELRSRIPYYFFFAVEVDQRTGEIFWWERQSEAGVPKLDALAIEVLKNLRFETYEDHLIESGHIEIVIALLPN